MENAGFPNRREKGLLETRANPEIASLDSAIFKQCKPTVPISFDRYCRPHQTVAKSSTDRISTIGGGGADPSGYC